MNDNIRSRVYELLSNYQDDTSKMNALRYELDHLIPVSGDEMIDSMNYGHGEGDGTGIAKGHISDKTAFIAMNYQKLASEANSDAIKELANTLFDMEQERDRLLHYISTLNARDGAVIRMTYIEPVTRTEIADYLKVSTKTVSTLRREAVNRLCKLYEFVESYRK